MKDSSRHPATCLCFQQGRMPEFVVSLSERLVESVTLAALEAYVLGDGRPGRRHRPAVETFGYVWGYGKGPISWSVGRPICH
jgi:hypothetical protein